MNRTFYALLLVPALASAACAIGEEGSQPTSEIGAAETPAVVNNRMIGTWMAAELRVGMLAQLVLKTDGTYHTGQVVACLIGPCPPVTQDGRYRLEVRSDASFLTLLTEKSEIVGKYQYVLSGETLRLRNVYTPTTNYAWQSMARAGTAWCNADTDCATQDLPPGPCAGAWMCTPEDACAYECGTMACEGAPRATPPGG